MFANTAMYENDGFSHFEVESARRVGCLPMEVRMAKAANPGWTVEWQLAHNRARREAKLAQSLAEAKRAEEAKLEAGREAQRILRWRTRQAKPRGYREMIPVVDFDFRKPEPANAGALREYFAHGPVENWWYYDGDMGKAKATLVAWCREVIGNGADRGEVLRTLFSGELRRDMDAAIGPVEPPAAIVALKEAFA